MTSTQCRSKNPATCPHHGITYRKEVALQEGDLNAYISISEEEQQIEYARQVAAAALDSVQVDRWLTEIEEWKATNDRLGELEGKRDTEGLTFEEAHEMELLSESHPLFDPAAVDAEYERVSNDYLTNQLPRIKGFDPKVFAATLDTARQKLAQEIDS